MHELGRLKQPKQQRHDHADTGDAFDDPFERGRRRRFGCRAAIALHLEPPIASVALWGVPAKRKIDRSSGRADADPIVERVSASRGRETVRWSAAQAGLIAASPE
ncbi:MAG TPA: hypothetical protein VFE77_04430 [Rhodanobacter sp.]|nr:hypothetical protein [Rhodanobacter sp.]